MERNRFELHPENAAPYDVLLGRLGDDRLRQTGIDWQTLPKADASAAHYFAPSGHAIAHPPFWHYWSTRGLELGDTGVSERESLALFGLPLAEPKMETNSSGDTVLTQWFERARFEDHGAKGVLLGLLGNEVRPNINPGTVPPPAPATPPMAAGVQVVQKGFGQDGREVGYGFILVNNQGRVAERIEYQVALYDAAGTVVDTDDYFIEILFANERAGFGDDVIVPEGKRVARIEVQVRQGRAGSTEFVNLGRNPLSGENTSYLPSRVAPKVSGVIRNSLAQDITDIWVHAVTYDASGTINGGGRGTLDFVPANGTSAAEVYVTTTGVPSRIEMFGDLTISSDIGR